jgi:D-tyrosyl-tRNA(Tyr) deacylase
MTDLSGRQGMALLREVRLGTCYRMRVESLLELIDAFDHEVMFLADAIAARLRHHRRTNGSVLTARHPGSAATVSPAGGARSAPQINIPVGRSAHRPEARPPSRP